MVTFNASRLWAFLTTVVSVFSITIAEASQPSRSVTVYAWPLSAPSPAPFVEITYDPSSLQASVKTSHEPVFLNEESRDPNGQSLVRVGLWDSASKKLRGIVTAVSTFDALYPRTVTLHIDEQGNCWHVELSRSGPRANSGNAKEDVAGSIQVEVARPAVGPAPVLNPPIIVDEEGKTFEKGPEKSFLQR
jgi:hypothetical protein